MPDPHYLCGVHSSAARGTATGTVRVDSCSCLVDSSGLRCWRPIQLFKLVESLRLGVPYRQTTVGQMQVIDSFFQGEEEQVGGNQEVAVPSGQRNVHHRDNGDQAQN